jgi:PiT family inorganic phosphate transporter
VSTRCLGVPTAIVMAAFFNLLGVTLMTIINATVAQTIYKYGRFRQ